LFYPKKVKGKNIICLESHWGGETLEPRTSIKPMLDFITIARGTQYSYNLVHTKEEFSYILTSINPKHYKMLLLAFHGRSEEILMGANSEFEVTLQELSGIMGTRFEGYGVHFSSCSVLKAEEESIRDFMYKTDVAFVTGYGQGVDYIESGLMDLAYLGRWFHYKSVGAMFTSVRKSYKDFIKENDFIYYTR